MAIVIDPPDYYEEAGWPKGAWSRGQFEGVRRLICDWDDRFDLISWIDTYPNSIYPYADGPADALASYAAIEGMGEQGSETYTPTDGLRAPMVLATYPKARVTVKYSTDGPTYFGGTLISEWLLPDSETIDLDRGTLRWDNNDGEAVNNVFSLRRYRFQYVIRYHQLLTVPWWVLDRVETCNERAVGGNLLGLTFAAQRLLYQPPTIRTSYTTGALTRYEVTVHYKYHPAGWNKFWRKSTGAYESTYLAGGAQFIPYPYSYILYGY